MRTMARLSLSGGVAAKSLTCQAARSGDCCIEGTGLSDHSPCASTIGRQRMMEGVGLRLIGKADWLCLLSYKAVELQS